MQDLGLSIGLGIQGLRFKASVLGVRVYRGLE